MINEPTMVILVYWYKTIGNNNKLITVLDFGKHTRFNFITIYQKLKLYILWY